MLGGQRVTITWDLAMTGLLEPRLDMDGAGLTYKLQVSAQVEATTQLSRLSRQDIRVAEMQKPGNKPDSERWRLGRGEATELEGCQRSCKVQGLFLGPTGPLPW